MKAKVPHPRRLVRFLLGLDIPFLGNFPKGIEVPPMPILRQLDPNGILHTRAVGSISYGECIQASDGFAEWFPHGTPLYELVLYEFGAYYDLSHEQAMALVEYSKTNLQRWSGGAICLVSRTDLIYASAVLFVDLLTGFVPQNLNCVATEEEGMRWLHLQKAYGKR